MGKHDQYWKEVRVITKRRHGISNVLKEQAFVKDMAVCKATRYIAKSWKALSNVLKK
jgi:hypothetical protein